MSSDFKIDPRDDPMSIWRSLGRFLADAAATEPEPLTHDGPCGAYGRCPTDVDNPRAQLELLPNGDLIARCRDHHGTHRPGDPAYALLVKACSHD